MRIIAGELRSRRLWTPPDDSTTRPIPDRLKKSLFDLLRGHFEGANVFDGFAGTGSIGLEALSRGADHCTFAERDPFIAKILAKNIEALGVADRAELVQGDALGLGSLARARRPLHLAFLDPPYALVRETAGFRRVMAQLANLADALDSQGYAILRTPWPLRHAEGGPAPHTDEPDRPAHRKKTKDRRDWRHQLEREASGKPPPRAAPPKPTIEERELSDDELEAELQGAADAHAAAAHAAGLQLVTADMTLPNALGPETHAYRGMGVHLYMKKPPSDAGR